jgi:hypothetical protein
MMGYDKLRLLTPRHPSIECLDEINAEYRQPPDQRKRFNFSPVHDRSRRGEVDRIGIYHEVMISTKKGVSPQFMLQLNMIAPGGKQPPQTVIECNPNNFKNGYKGLCDLVDWILPDAPDLTISRVDLNGELVGTSVQYCHDVTRIPGKRKSSDVGRIWRNKGAETFEIGKPPSQLVVYDKIAERKYKGEDISVLPPVLTRYEWRYKHDHCPVRLFSEFHEMRDIDPFTKVQFIESAEYYDFKTDPVGSYRRLGYNAAVARLGAQDAYRVANTTRNFKRDSRAFLVERSQLHERLRDSYLSSVEKFFNNEGADVYAMHGKAPELPEECPTRKENNN